MKKIFTLKLLAVNCEKRTTTLESTLGVTEFQCSDESVALTGVYGSQRLKEQYYYTGCFIMKATDL